MSQYSKIFKPFLLNIGLAAMLLGALGCTEKTSSSASVTPDYLHLTGTVFNGPGNGIEGTKIYLIGLDAPLAVSGVGGEFAFTISDAQLYQAVSLEKTRLGDHATDTFNLLFDFESETRLMGISRPIPYSSRGTFELGDINVGLPASVTGKVTRLHNDGDFTPETGVKVWIAGRETLTSEQGHFAFTNLPAGSLQAYMLRKDQPAVATELVLDPGEDLTLPYPLVILPSDEVTGWLSPLPPPDPEGLVALSHPYRRSFKVHASPIAKYIRYHHDESTFEDFDGETSPWKPVRDKIHYDFPSTGTHKLYFQFADENKEETSDIRILTATSDIFYDSDGIVIGDGSGIIRSSTVTVQIDLPAAATEMRLAESASSFNSSLQWLKAQPIHEFVFTRPTIADAGLSPNKELFIQFRRGGENSEESVLYRASARLEPFLGLDHSIMTIGDGSDTFRDRVVDINIDLPDNAWDMRIFTEKVDGNTLVGGVLISNAVRPELERNYIRAQEKVSFVFLTPGHKTIFMQLRDRSGLLSPIYKKDVFVLPFTAEAPGFLIDNGATSSITRNINLEFLPPEGAVGFRVSESQEELLLSPYQVLKNIHEMVLERSGLRTVYVQFQDYDGINSFVYSQTIYIDPFLNDPGSITLNAGASLTQFPSVDIDINPPLTAKDMKLSLAPETSEGNFLCGEGTGNNSIFGPVTPTGDRGWQPVDLYAEALLEEPGAYMICAQFRTENGDVGTFIQRSIIYDPFPNNAGSIVINNDDAVTNTRLVTLDFTFPAAAQRMRIAGNPTEILIRPFEELNSQLEFSLPYSSQDASDRNQKVYVQFQSVDGYNSAVFEDFIVLELFPSSSLNATINNGDATTNNPQLMISLTPPPDATGIQISEDIEDLGDFNHPAFVPETTVDYTLEDDSLGMKTLYFRYRTDDGRISSVFTDSIELN